LTDVKTLHHFIRTPTWIIPPRLEMMKMGPLAPVLSQLEMDAQANFAPSQIEKFKGSSALYDMFCDALEQESHGKFHFVLTEGSPQQQILAGKCAEFMTAMLGGDERLCKALIPTFPLGCRRLTAAPGYLESLRAENVVLVTDNIKRCVPQGIELVTGEIIELDAIICATGFESSLLPPFPIVGKQGNIQDIWNKETPKAYMSLAVPGLPNYFSKCLP
jgi:cation diffusion facilitator CzcD-associated flavoprotein CzcO